MTKAHRDVKTSTRTDSTRDEWASLVPKAEGRERQATIVWEQLIRGKKSFVYVALMIFPHIAAPRSESPENDLKKWILQAYKRTGPESYSLVS